MIKISCVDTFLPYEFDNKYEAVEHIIDRCHILGSTITRGLIKIDHNKGHLVLRCPIVADYITIDGPAEDIYWIDNQLRIRDLYKPIS